MSDYDFSTLNDKDFEELVVDLLSAEFGNRVERFKVGKDGGVDGRFFIGKKEQIIQCKHWLKSGLPALITSLSKTELPKVEKLAPSKYFLATSLSLSRNNKAQIKEIFKEFMDDESSIFGKEDLNDLLKKHSQIEKNHYKLWISSTAVLETIMNSDVLGRSTYKLEEINDGSHKYVITQNHEDAIYKLEEIGSVIISGLPGIGKTTLADQICKYYLAQDFEFYYVEDSISSIEKVYKKDIKQIFYFDDFLGSNYLEVISNNEDSKIASFFRRVEKDKSKRFILTSRTNILNQGKRLSTAFQVQHIDKNEYEIIVRNLKDLDKAKILYNHIFFSELPNNFIDELYFEERYRDIIKHESFNPRLISFITDYQRLVNIEPGKYWSYIESVLEDPSLIWGNVFERQIDEISKDIVCIVVLNKGRVVEGELEKYYYNLCSIKNVCQIKPFKFIMKGLMGSLVNRYISGKEVYFDLFNPSIVDFVIKNFFRNKHYILTLLYASGNFNSIENVVELYKNGLILKNDFICIFNEYLDKKIKTEEDNLFLVKLFELGANLNLIDKRNIDGAALYFGDFTHYDKRYYCNEFFSVILFYINYQGTDFFKNFSNFLERDVLEVLDEFDFESLSTLTKVVTMLKMEKDHKFYQCLKKVIVEYLSQEITSMIIEDNIIGSIYLEEDFEEDSVVSYIEDQLASFFTLEFGQSDIDEIYYSFDLDDALQANMNSEYEPDSDERISARYNENYDNLDPIGDLFDRS